MSSLLDYARENPIEYEPERFEEYLQAFKKADRALKKDMGWSGPRIKQYAVKEVRDYQKRVLAEAYDNKRIDFDDALVGYMLVLGGHDYESVTIRR